MDKRDHILIEYDNDHPILEQFCSRLEILIHELLEVEAMPIHGISARVKAKTSLERKLDKPESNYECLSDITDIVGVRITTFFSDDVDKVAKILEREFSVDRQNTVDKREVQAPDQFGYLSLHHVVELPEHRTRLTENLRYRGKKAEIQTRSILQHAWAEIEHDLGYKAAGVPTAIRRRFSRLAGLLELADEEFCAIRNFLTTYQQEVSSTIKVRPQEIELNKVSLEEMALQDENMQFISEEVAFLLTGNRELTPYVFSDKQSIELELLGINTIGGLQRVFEDNKQLIVNFAEAFLKDRVQLGKVKIDPSIAIFYLLYFLTVKAGGIERVEEYVKRANIGGPVGHREIAERVEAAYREVVAG